ncbi:MAG: LptF/LptG family permease, partial [Verrucomicrobiota bacterium]
MSIPWSFLTAILLTFGRMSADSELVSMRMAGQSMPRICLPVAWVGLFFSAICAWMNLSVTPAAKTEMENMKDTVINRAKRDPMLIFPDKQVMTDAPGYLIYANKEDGVLKEFQMVQMKGFLPELLVISKQTTVELDLDDPKKPAMNMTLDQANLMMKGETGDFMSETRPFYMDQAETGLP